MFELYRKNNWSKRINFTIDHKTAIKLLFMQLSNLEFQEKLNKIDEMRTNSVRRTINRKIIAIAAGAIHYADAIHVQNLTRKYRQNNHNFLQSKGQQSDLWLFALPLLFSLCH